MLPRKGSLYEFCPVWLRGIALSIGWMGLALLIYSFQLKGGWRFDDAHHLAFLSQYDHFEYIYAVEAARLQSGAHYTPFNILTYDLAHRFAPLSEPAWFYAFHIALLGLAAAALFLYLRSVVSLTGAICGGLVFLCGFPLAGMSGQLMVGHYIVGFIFAGLCLYFYENSAKSGKISALSAIFYLLACLSKEIFLPLILFPALDPRFTLRQRLVRSLPWLMVAAIFWLLRTRVVGNVVGGYNNGLPATPAVALESALSGLYAYATMSGPSVFMSVLLIVCGAVSVAIIGRRFGVIAAVLIAGGVMAGTILPLLPVALQVGPQAYTDIRLLSGLWFVLSCAAAITINSLGKVTSIPRLSAIAATVIVSVTAWTSAVYITYSPLSSFSREFDGVTRHLISRNQCYIVDKYGWSSWMHDLSRTMWPQSPSPLMAPYAIINILGEAGHSICEIREDGIIHPVGQVDGTEKCSANEDLSLVFNYNGSHLKMAFGPDPDAVYYIEVPDAYLLKVPASFIMPFPDRKRLKNFRLMKINQDNTVSCSPLLHFDAASESTIKWNGHGE